MGFLSCSGLGFAGFRGIVELPGCVYVTGWRPQGCYSRGKPASLAAGYQSPYLTLSLSLMSCIICRFISFFSNPSVLLEPKLIL